MRNFDDKKKALRLMRNQSRTNRAETYNESKPYTTGAISNNSAGFYDDPTYYSSDNVEIINNYSKKAKSVEPKEHSGWDSFKESSTKLMNDILRTTNFANNTKVLENSFDLLALELIEQWNDLQELKQKLLDVTTQDGLDPKSKDFYTKQLLDVDSKINNLNEYFKNDGRGRKPVRDLMYSRNRDEWNTFGAYVRTITDPAKQSITKSWNETNSELTGLEKLFPSGAHLWRNVEFLTNLIGSGIGGAYKTVTGAFKTNEELIDEAIRIQTDPNDNLLNSTFIGNNPVTNTPDKNTTQFVKKSKINEVRNNLNIERQLLLNKLAEDEYNARLGVVTAFGHKLWTYDPKVADWWEKEDQEYDGLIDAFSMPSHLYASMGSTIGLFGRQARQMGLEATGMWLINKYGADALLPESKGAKYALKGAEWAIKGGLLASGLKATMDSRVDETYGEELEAYLNRVLSEVYKNGADLEKVVKAVDKGILENLGSMNKKYAEQALDLPLDERLKLGMIYGIKTGDEIWDSTLISAQKGLNTLINQNNALAFADYIELLPYLPMTGSIISKSIKKELTMMKWANKHPNFTRSLGERAWNTNKVQKGIQESLLNPGGFITSKVDKIAGKVVKNGYTKLGLYGRDVANYAINRTLLGLGISMKEGIEEGQQELLQMRYQRGEYDKEYNPYTFFDGNEAIDVAELGLEAVASYLGVHFGDQDNGSEQIRKAMNIGFSSSMLFNNLTHTVTNITGTGAGTNMRKLISDLKNSSAAYKLMADNYERDQDYQHATIFYNMLKSGRNPQQIKERLQFMFDNKTENEGGAITQDMIDADKLLLDNVSYMYNNRQLAKHEKQRGNKKYGEEHMYDIIEGAVRLTNLDKTNQLIRELGKNINSTQDKARLLMELLLDDNVSKEEKDQILNSFPELEKLFNNFQKMFDKATSENQTKHKSVKLEITKVLNNLRKGAIEMTDAERLLSKLGVSEDLIESAIEDALSVERKDTNQIAETLYNTSYKNIFKSKFAEEMQEEIDKIKIGKDETSSQFDERLKTSKRNLFVNNSKLRDYLRNVIYKEKKIYGQENIESEVTKRLEEIYDSNTLDDLYSQIAERQLNPIDKELFFLNTLLKYHVYKQTSAIEKALRLSEQQAKLLAYVKKMTGTDIDVSNLRGIVDELKFIKERNEEKLKKWYKTAKDNPFNSEDVEWDFDNEFTKNYESLLLGYYINGGLLGPMRAIAEAYSFGEVRPQRARNAIYGKDYEDVTEFDNIDTKRQNVRNTIDSILEGVKSGEIRVVDAQNQLEELGVSSTSVDRALDDVFSSKKRESISNRLANEIDLEIGENNTKNRSKTKEESLKNNREAAWKIIENRRKESEKRERIARRRFIDDAVEDLDSNEQTNLSDEQLNQQEQQQGVQQNKPQVKPAQLSPGAEALRREILHEDTKKTQSKSEAIEKRKQELREQQESEKKGDEVETNNIEQHTDEHAGPVNGPGSILGSIVSSDEELGLLEDTHESNETGTNQKEQNQIEFNEQFENSENFDDIKNSINSNSSLDTVYPFDGTINIKVTQEEGKPTYYRLNVSLAGNKMLLKLLNMLESGNFISQAPIDFKNYTIENITLISDNNGVHSIMINAVNNNDEHAVTIYKQEVPDDEEKDNEEDEILGNRTLDDILNQLDLQLNNQIDKINQTIDLEYTKSDKFDEALLRLDTEREAIIQEFERNTDKAWIQIDDFSQLSLDENNNTVYNGKILPEDEAKYIEEQLKLLSGIDSGELNQNNIPMNSDENENLQNVTDEFIGNYLCNTFFYAVDDRKNTSLADKGTIDTFNGVKLPKQIGTASELSQNLSKKGWLLSTKQYYIVTRTNKVDNVLNKDHIQDAFTVSLIIEDDNKCYITSLRDLGITKNDNGSFTNNELYWRNWLQTKNVDVSRIEQELGHNLPTDSHKKANAISKFLKDKIKELAKIHYANFGTVKGTDIGFDQWYDNGVVAGNEQKNVDLRKGIIEACRTIILKRYSMNSTRILDNQDIDYQIDKLRKLRNEIIDQYVTKVSDGENTTYIFSNQDGTILSTNVTPIQVRQSNGKINNLKKNGSPILRNIIGDNTTIDNVTERIEDGKLIFGVGRGALSPNNQYEISPLLDKDSGTKFNGKGLSGKIYLFVNSLIPGAKQVPIMLSEDKFNYQYRIKNGKKEKRYGIKPVLELTSEGLQNTSETDADGYNYNPSAAEVLFYMLTRKFDFGTQDEELIDNIVEFFIHSGEKTIFKNNLRYQNNLSNENPMFNIISSKQLWYHKENGVGVLEIALPNKNGGYSLASFTEKDLFATGSKEIEENCKNNREACINAIANLMHWNTDKDHINMSIDAKSGTMTDMSMFIKYIIDTQAKTLRDCKFDVDEYLDQEVSILGCDQFTFKLSDFFEKNGNDVRSRNVNVLAWMLKNGKLLTDVGDPIFKDPFVFAYGVKQPSTQKVEDVGKTGNEGHGSERPFVNQEKIDELKQTILSDDESMQHILIDEESRKNLKSGVEDNIIITNINFNDYDDAEDSIKQKIFDFLKAYTKHNPKAVFDVKSAEDINSKIIDTFGSEIESGSRLLTVKITNKDGKYKYIIGTQPTDENLSDPKYSSVYYTGVYSALNKSKFRRGSTSAKESRLFLYDKLGIRQYNVVVRDALLKSTNSDLAYGVTELSLDAITGEIIAKFGLSTADGSRGVVYHEAWHYVNLLLHNKTQRESIYDEYYKTHKKQLGENPSDEEIEEAMAEEFLEYMEGKTDKTIPGIIKNFFRNAMDFVNVLLDRKKYRQIFKSINEGGYKDASMLDSSIIEFCEKYEGEVNSIQHSVSGYNRDVINNLPNVDRYQDLYEAVDSVINYTFLRNNIEDLDTAYSFAKGDNFTKVMNNIDAIISDLAGDDDIEDLDDPNIKILQDIQQNPDIVKQAIINRFKTIGIDALFKKVKKPKESIAQDQISQLNNDTEQKTDDADNVWDKLELTVSRKDNAGFRVKMFLSTIPMLFSYFDSKGNLKYDSKRDNFGVRKTWEFDRVWSAVSEDLADITSYGDMIDGEYDKRSLRGIVKRLAESNGLYKSIDAKLNKLDSKNDQNSSSLKSLLFGILNAHKNHIQTINLVSPQLYETVDLESGGDIFESRKQFTNAVADVDKEWQTSDDGMYNPAYTLPRKWSQVLITNGLGSYDQTSGKTVISSEYVKHVADLLNKIKTQIHNTNNAVKAAKTEEEKNKIYSQALAGNNTNKLLRNLIKLYNIIGIPVDASVLNLYISRRSNVSGSRNLTGLEIFDVVSDIVNSKERGSLTYFVNLLDKHKGTNSIKMTTDKGKTVEVAIDGLYTGYGLHTPIASLALAYAAVYPSLKEISTKSANGDTLYPVNLNNYLSDVTNQANKDGKKWSDKIKMSKYCGHSIIADVARDVNESNEETKLRLNTFVGMKLIGKAKGSDFLEITPVEDYLSKLFLIENNNLIFPTMADKKTWYSLSVGSSSLATKEKIGSTSGFRLDHSAIVYSVPEQFKRRQLLDIYLDINEVYNEDIHGSFDNFLWKTVLPWYNDLKTQGFNKEIDNEIEQRYKTINPTSYRRFGRIALNTFCGYYIDELESLIDYYDAKHIKAVCSDLNLLRKNYHGKVKEVNGKNRLMFGGNGGLFRYFYDVKVDSDKTFSLDGSFNLNLKLEALYQLQQQIMNGDDIKNVLEDENSSEPNIKLMLMFPEEYRASKNDLDGFEFIRQYLYELRDNVTAGADNYEDYLVDAINDKLIAMTEQEMKRLSDPNSPLHLIDFVNGQYQAAGIPILMLLSYLDKLKLIGAANNGPLYAPGNVKKNIGSESAIFSLIASYVANGAISVIEVEKIYSGDPAQYKYTYIKDENNKDLIENRIITMTVGNQVVQQTVGVKILDDSFGDKIKRLGGTLSPGTELRLDFTQKEIEDDINIVKQYYTDEEEIKGQAVLGGSKYTVLDVQDIECPSEYLDHIKNEFKKESVMSLIRSGKVEFEGNKAQFMNELYFNEYKFNDYYNKIKSNLVSGTDLTVEQYVEKELKSASHPYSNITVSDAQVFIRPAMYRKIRKALGDWTNLDEEAYWIIQKDDTWMSDPKKATKVRKFLQYALKMSYFANENTSIGSHTINQPLYNKMAIFPLFKFLRSTNTGRMLYDRMNMRENELDMIAFTSAVKVGAFSNAVLLIDKDASVKEAASKLSKALNKKSNIHLNYLSDQQIPHTGKNTLAVKVQDLHNLRMLLNTHAHEDDIRSIGTQMFKIAFENIFDDEFYGYKKIYDKNGKYRDAQGNYRLDESRKRLGSQIKQDIMRLINNLTMVGVKNLLKKYYTLNEDGTYNIDEHKLRNLVLRIVENNGLGAIAEDISNDNNSVIASLSSRTVFEQSVSKIVNEEIVNINTQGGTAIQQSMFGFSQFGRGSIETEGENDEYIKYNDGKDLKWNADNGSMEVILSIKFFKSVVPKKYQKSFVQMRQWLIDNDVIGGYKTESLTPLTAEQSSHNENLYKSIDELLLSEEYLDILKNAGCETILDVIKESQGIFNKKHNSDFSFKNKAAIKEVLTKLNNFDLDFDSDIIEQKPIIGAIRSNPKPFGIGYRIPTQGMSSMFSFTVADVLPHNVGDLIIVPREFTAQTGSDFDVDKIYLATMSYKDGVLENESENPDSAGAISNELLNCYMDIIADPKNFSQSRGSIDVFTSILKNTLLPELRDQSSNYVTGMHQLMPSFQTFRKMEFSTGKTGIGPFALNVTNLALTQYTHLTIDFSKLNTKNGYNLKPLDSVYGKDGRLISGWLSAMVNAHVDVAKDAYIFDLNVNKCTYNMANFLLRTGNGLGTFSFLAQPILKLYAQNVNKSKGLYGTNIDGNTNAYELYAESISKKLQKDYLKDLKKAIEQLKPFAFNDEKLQSDINELSNIYMYFDNKVNGTDYGELKPSIKHIKKENIINEEIGIRQLKNLKEGLYLKNKQEITVSDVDALLKLGSHYAHQLLTMMAFNELSTYALEMSSLVTCSQIDTKKFGNNLAEQRLFYNKHMLARYSRNVHWILNTENFWDSVPAQEGKDGKPERNQNAATDIALNTYFNSMFLEDKLSKAMLYTEEILKTQTIVATDAFKDIYKNIMQRMYGLLMFEDYSTGEKVVVEDGFGRILKKERAMELSNAMETVTRYNSLMTYGYDIYQTEMQQNQNTRMIDFTIGGDRTAIVEKMNQLFFGDGQVSSIFERLASFINSMKINPNAVDENGKKLYKGLVNNYGEIQNDLLNYLTPLLPSNNYPIGRMLLSESQMNVPGEIKRRYITAFSQLLSHPNLEIQELAKDLVLYAYYSSYDLNTPGSFFDLVPKEYRAQYDMSLQKLMDTSKQENGYERVMNAITDGVGINNGITNLLDIICRNFWYNEDIVPSYNYADDEYDINSRVNILDKARGETIIPGKYDIKAQWTFPSAIISNRVKEDQIYFKLQQNGLSYIYKKIGTIVRTSNKEGVKDGENYYVYACVPKAGSKLKGVTQYEFYATYENDSIFGQNRLSEKMSEESVRSAVLTKIDKYNTPDSKYTCEVKWDVELLSVTRMSNNPNAYVQNRDVNDSFTRDTITHGTTIQLVSNNDFDSEYIALKKADIIINVVTKDSVNSRNVANTYKDKVFDLVLGREFDIDRFIEFVEQVKKSIETDQTTDTSNGIILHFTTPISDFGFSIDDSNETFRKSVLDEIENIIQSKIQNYYDQDLKTNDQIDETEKELAKDVFENELRNNKHKMNSIAKQASSVVVYDTINSTLMQLLYAGINVNTITASAKKDHTIMARSISYTKTTLVGQSIENNALTYINSSWITSMDTGKYYTYFKQALNNIYQSMQIESAANDMSNDAELDDIVTKAIDIVTQPTNNPVDLDDILGEGGTIYEGPSLFNKKQETPKIIEESSPNRTQEEKENDKSNKC